MVTVGRTLLITFLVVALLSGKVLAEDKISGLSDLIEEGLENNTRVKAAHNEWKAAEHRVKYLRGLPDPKAKYTYLFENVETRVGPQEHKYGVSQTIPFPGKLSSKSNAQLKQSEELEQKYEAVKREIIKEIKFLYYDIYWLDEATRITEQEKSVVESVKNVAERRYEANQINQQDVIRAQLELSRLLNKLFQLRQNRKTLQAKLNNVLNRPQGTQINIDGKIEKRDFEYTLEGLRDIAMSARQEILAAKVAVEKAQYERSLAAFEYFPDITFGFDYIQVGSGSTISANDGQDAYMGTVAINVPLWVDKLQAQVKEKKELLNARLKDAESIEDDVMYEVEDLYYKILTYKDIITLYESALVPQSKQALEAAKTGYESGRINFIDWLDSERVLLQTRLAYYKSTVDYMKSIAFLERIVGKDL
jgi:outer membrane protein TolC